MDANEIMGYDTMMSLDKTQNKISSTSYLLNTIISLDSNNNLDSHSQNNNSNNDEFLFGKKKPPKKKKETSINPTRDNFDSGSDSEDENNNDN